MDKIFKKVSFFNVISEYVEDDIVAKFKKIK